MNANAKHKDNKPGNFWLFSGYAAVVVKSFGGKVDAMRTRLILLYKKEHPIHSRASNVRQMINRFSFVIGRPGRFPNQENGFASSRVQNNPAML